MVPTDPPEVTDPPAVAERPRDCLAAGFRDEVVLTYDGMAVTWADVAAAADARGTWPRLVRTVALGLAAEGRLTPQARDAVDAAVSSRGADFRRHRQLYTADEFAAWLARRQVSVPQWRAFLRRELALEWTEPGAGPDAGLDRDAALDKAVTVRVEDVHAAAVLSGFLDTEASALAEDLALVDAEATTGADRGTCLRRAVDGGRQVRAAIDADDEALAELVRQHAVEWAPVRVRLLSLPSEDAAEEVALCVRADGIPLAEVAASAGVPLEHLDTTLGEAPAVLQGLLMGAQAGDLVGPVDDAGAHLVAEVVERCDAALDDPRTRARAAAILLARAVAERSRSRLRWDWHG